MEILAVSVNHNTAGAEEREKVSMTTSQRIDLMNDLLDDGISEVIALSTCNRTEIYAAVPKSQKRQYIERLTGQFVDMAGDDGFSACIQSCSGTKAVQHIYRVAAGLDSVVLGEDQILGQLREAHELALDMGATGKFLNRTVRDAIATAKLVKTEIKISEEPISVCSIGIKYVEKRLGTLEGKCALVVGTGKMGRQALSYLSGMGLEKIMMTNRTHHKVVEAAKAFDGVEVVPYDERYEWLKKADILISATASPHVIFKNDLLGELEKPLTVLDMAIPRDVDPQIGMRPDVFLSVVDDLKAISDENTEKRRALSLVAEERVREAVDAHMTWMLTSRVDPVINKLASKREKIGADTLDILHKKIRLDEKEKAFLEKMLHSALKRMVREPIINLKKIEDTEEQDITLSVVERLFDFKENN